MVKFYTFHFTLFTLRSFAFAGLFLVGNNVFATDTIIVDPGDDGVGGITCHQDWKWGRNNVCWLRSNINAGCYFTGYIYDICSR